MWDQQLEKMLRKLDREQNKVLLGEEKTKLTTVAEGEEERFQNKKRNKQGETNRWQRIQHQQRKQPFRK